ncbi:kinesin-like protein KIF27 [Diadema antillarum]|uniref:kinesin-like protein KIF27 n=1 Tax=Diadema antillarum TaxID=105358 RepID=UPI003A84D30A
MQECPVKVAVRVRPLLPQERLHRHELCVRVIPKTNQIVVGKDRAFTFDHVMSSKTSQETAYRICVENLVTSFFEGYNATVFAYGQTGSGKTFTIGGADTASIMEEEQGIIPRAVGHIFDIIKNNHNIDYVIHVSYIEVYKEDLRDLLDLETSSKDIHIREDEQGNTVILGATELPCSSLDDVLRCLELGSAHRHTGATNMNEHSSRSHSIFTILMEQRWRDGANSPSASQAVSPRGEEELSDSDEDPDFHFMSAKFHFVDLAGSERAHRTGNAGERFKESVYINSGLLSLGNVISALSDPKRKSTHIPYRDSKITRLLKDSLGGNAKTCMITCISPSAVNFDETLNSLKYANRARNIKNKPIVNKDKQATRIAEMQTEIQALRDELQRHRLTTAQTEVRPDTLRIGDLEDQISRLRTELAHYHVCTEEASNIFSGLQDSEQLTRAQLTAVSNWLDLANEMRDQTQAPPTDLGKEGQERIRELEKRLKQALADLSSDEQIFADKRRENSDLLARLKDVESEREQCANELEMSLDKIRRLEGALVEQQTKIAELQTQLGTETGGGGFELPLSAGRRAMSVPPHAMRTKSVSGSTTARDRSKPQPRRLHTSPPLFSLERIVQGFRARSQLLIRELEDGDAVLQERLTDSSEAEDSDPESRALGQTWNKEEKGGVSSARQRRRTQILNNKNFGSTITKGRAPSIEETGSEGVDLRSSLTTGQERVRASQLHMQESQQKLRDLTLNIRLKEELIRELVQTGKDSEAANKKYSEKIMHLEKDVKKAREDLTEARRHLHDLGSKGEMEVKEKGRLQVEYQKKMEKAHTKVKELMKKQQESERILKMQSQREKKIEDLEIAVGRMKQHQELLQVRLREEGERKLKLERDLQRDQQKIKDLELRNEQQQKILKRKTEEVAAAQRKLRLGVTHSEEQEKLEEQRKWLDTEVEKVLQRKKKMTELEDELRKREAILSKKEVMVRERGELEMKKLRSSQSLSRDMTGISSKLEAVERRLEEKGQSLRVSLDSERPVIGREIESLQAEKERLLQQRIKLDEKLQQGTLLSTTEERRLIELDEGVDALDAAIEYKNEVIASRKKELRRNDLTQSEAILVSRLNSLAPTETRSLLARYFEKVVDLREADRRKELELSELEVKIEEQERVIRTLENSLRSSSMEADRKLVSQQKEHERKVQMLMRELQQDGGGGGGGDSQMDGMEHKLRELERDLYYYKKTSRDLKKKLREFVTASTESSNGHAEMKAVRGHHSGTPGLPHQPEHTPREATPVRKSRKEVRELSEAEVSLRRSSASQRSSFVADSIESGAPTGSNPWT